MKRENVPRMLVAVIIAFVISFLVGCKKNYNCTCIHTFSDPRTYAYSVDTTAISIHDTKKSAESKCKDRENSLGGGVAATATCTLN